MALSVPPSVNAPAENAASSTGTQPFSKLKKSAQEFESILLQSWLEKMNQTFVGTSESKDAAHDTVSGLGTQAIASALAARGGIGIAAMLLRQFSGEGVVAGSSATRRAASSSRRRLSSPLPVVEGAEDSTPNFHNKVKVK